MFIDTSKLDYWVGKDGQVSYSDDENPDENPDRVGECDSDDFRTASERLPNDIRTVSEREADDIQIRNDGRRTSQTLAASIQNGLLPADRPQDFVELYADVVRLLNDGRFLKGVIGERKLKYTFSVPKKVCEAINEELGLNLKKFTYDKIQYSSEYCKRYSPLTFWSMVLFSIIALGASIYLMQPKALSELSADYSDNTYREDSIYCQTWGQKRNFLFFPYRIQLMHNDSTFRNGGEAEREEIMTYHMEKQKQASAK